MFTADIQLYRQVAMLVLSVANIQQPLRFRQMEGALWLLLVERSIYLLTVHHLSPLSTL